MATVVTLLSDFGMADAYVAAMKGVILRIATGATVVDITHEVPPQDVTRGALVLADAAPWYPAGTVHVAVVDPGVGTERRAIVARVDDQIFVAPDNGLLGLVWSRGARRACHVVTRDDLGLPSRSATFHGRDLFAPVGAALAAGRVAVEEVGEAAEPMPLALPEPVVEDSSVTGVVLTADHFGNLVTCIEGRLVPRDRASVRVELGGATARLVRTYGEAVPGELVALVGSTGLLELAVAKGSAARALGAGCGAPVCVRW
jgi:S-adenosylmethionine hydrolase